MTVVAFALLMQIVPLLPPRPPVDLPPVPTQCRMAKITGYNRMAPYFSALTYDETPIRTTEPIVAASFDIPMGAMVTIDGLGVYRVADRGSGLYPTHLDIAVWSDDEAFAITSTRQICYRKP